MPWQQLPKASKQHLLLPNPMPWPQAAEMLTRLFAGNLRGLSVSCLAEATTSMNHLGTYMSLRWKNLGTVVCSMKRPETASKQLGAKASKSPDTEPPVGESSGKQAYCGLDRAEGTWVRSPGFFSQNKGLQHAFVGWLSALVRVWC